MSQSNETKLRVAVYCRAAGEDAQDSVDSLTEAYTELINRKPDCTLAGIYVDHPEPDRRYKRPQFLRLIRDCSDGLVDCILCRSITEFARSGREEVNLLRNLRNKGIRMVFESEGFDSDSMCFENLLAALSAFAEERTSMLSAIGKRGRRDKARDGEAYYIPLYGYRRSGDSYEVVPEEAEVVRLVFDCYEHGANSADVAKILSGKGIPTPAGRHTTWRSETVRSLISNEKFAGDYQTQKGYYKETGGSRYLNGGELPSVYLTDHHPAIIQREQFERCNVILNMRKKSTPLQYPFGEYLRCPYCGSVLYRRFAPKHHYYCCEGRGACRQFVIKADQVDKAILEAYENVDLKAVLKKAGLWDYSIAIEAEKLLRAKDKHRAFDRIDFWWLDDLVREITFGRHSYTDFDLESTGEDDADDRTISIHWRCGVITTVSSGVRIDSQDPRRRAEEWDAFILNNPDRYPQLIEEIQAKMK